MKKEPISKNGIKSKFLLSIIIVISIVLFIGMIIGYVKKFEHALIEENSNHLEEIASHIVVNMQTVAKDMTGLVESIALFMDSFEEKDEKLGYLNQIKEKYEFSYMGFAMKDGKLEATLSSESIDISKEYYFKEAMNGKSVIHYVERKIFKDHAISGILIAVPIYGESMQPQGVLCGMLDVIKLNDVMGVESFNGEGYSYIIDRKGNIILRSKSMDYSNLYTALEHTNFDSNYSVESVIQDISGQKQGMASYSYFGVDKFLYHKYLGIDSWSVVTIVEKDVITAKTTQLSKELTFAAVMIIILFTVLITFAVFSSINSSVRKHTVEANTAFLANMSHEIRTPMNAIVGISEILLREELTRKQKDYVLSIVNAGNGLLTIINDILDVSKIESGKFGIVEEEYELESLLYDITTIIAIKIGEKPVEFIVELDPSLPKFVVGDMIRVKQILLNVIGNAVKFTDRGSIKLKIDGNRLNGKIILSMPVSDTGIGIKKEDLEKLFVSFYQVDTHKNRNLEGTGLGLAISKRLCQMMEGDITVESEYGRGSLFTIKLSQGVTRQERMLHPSKPDRFHILIYEPDCMLGEYYSNCLHKMKLIFEIFSNLEEFKSHLKKGGFTHVLANRHVMKQLKEEYRENKAINFVTLLHLNEQALVEANQFNVFVPLFMIHFSAILYQREELNHLMKGNGMDILAIQPMPFVRILLVDDNEVNLQVANGLMNPYQMKVDCVLSGKKAIQSVQEKEYDLIFMDHMMPEMDGVEAMKEIRNLPDNKYKKIPIIALTANITHDAKDFFLEAGFDDFLAKPIETVKLNGILKKWLKEVNEKRGIENPELMKKYQENLKKQEKENVSIGIHTKLIDFNEGICKLGSEDVYCNILETYCHLAKEKMESIKKLPKNNLERFVIEIHGLKSASMGIFAVPVGTMAEKLEQLGKEGKLDEIEKEMPKFLKEWQDTISNIKEFLKNDKKQEEKPKGSLTTEILTQLENAFFHYDTEELNRLFCKLLECSYNEVETEFLHSLKYNYENYEFEKPMKIIKKFTEELEMKGER